MKIIYFRNRKKANRDRKKQNNRPDVEMTAAGEYKQSHAMREPDLLSGRRKARLRFGRDGKKGIPAYWRPASHSATASAEPPSVLISSS